MTDAGKRCIRLLATTVFLIASTPSLRPGLRRWVQRVRRWHSIASERCNFFSVGGLRKMHRYSVWQLDLSK